MIRVLPNARSVVPVLGLLLVGGCSWGSGPSDRDIPEMHRKFSRTFDIQTGIVEGDLQRVKEAATWIVTREEKTSLPPGSEDYERAMLGHAAMVARAQTLQSAADRTGHLAAACGSCHQSMARGPRFVIGSALPDGDSREAQMIRHLWAADRMWEGLVGPSDAAWSAGASALAETGPALVQALRTSTTGGVSAGLIQEVRAVAGEAALAETQEDRADVYGRMLGTCSRCHRAIGIQVEM